MSGPHFRDYHLLLDEQSAQIFAMTDDLVERARKIGDTSLRSMVGSSLLLAGRLDTGAAAIFPVMLPSTLAPENSLTVYDVAAGPNSMAYAAIWWPIGFALAATYFVFVSRHYAGKISVKRDNQGFY